MASASTQGGLVISAQCVGLESAQGFGKTRILVLGVFPEPKLDLKEEWM
jgi:hypothetical protein